MTQLLHIFVNGGFATSLLYVELGVVVALSFALLKLIVDRLRGAAHAAGGALDEDAWLRQVVAERADQIVPDGDSRVAEENRSLRERLRFLEAKVLEHEILQEQMGSLPVLKKDNERLRRELKRLKQTVGRRSDDQDRESGSGAR